MRTPSWPATNTSVPLVSTRSPSSTPTSCVLVVEKPPSADLWVGQTDEGELGLPYRLMDQILFLLVDRGLPKEQVVAAGFDGFWSAITGDRGLLVAYLGLMAESVTDPKLQAATGHINEGFRAIIGKLIADAQRRGRGLLMDKESLIVLIIAGIHGLTLEYVQRGESPALTRAIADFQIWLTTVSAPHDERREVGPTPTAPRR